MLATAGGWACLSSQTELLLTHQADGWGYRTDSSPAPLALPAPPLHLPPPHTPGNASLSPELSPDPKACPGMRLGWLLPCCRFWLPALTSFPSPGDYEVSIKFNDEHIPDSPFVVPVASLSDDARRLTVTSLQVCVRGEGPSATLRDGRSPHGQGFSSIALTWMSQSDRHSLSPRACTAGGSRPSSTCR